MRAEYGLSHAYMISLWRSGRNGRLTGAGRLCQREIAHQVYCEPLPLFHASTVDLLSRSACFITSSSSTSRARQAEKAQKYPLRLHQPTMSQQSTSCWIRRCNRQYIFLPQFTLFSRCRAQDEKFLSQTRSQAPSAIATNSVSSLPQQRLDPSRGGGRWSPQFSREKGQTRAELFPKKKAHNERTPFPWEQSARAFRPTHKSCVSSGVRNADTDRHTS